MRKDSLWQLMGVGGRFGVIVGGLGVLIGFIATYMQDVRAGLFFTVIFGGPIFYIVFAFVRAERRKNWIFEHGESAEAVVLALKENGSSLQVGGALPRAGVSLLVEVHRHGQPSYETTTDTYLSVIDMLKFQRGAQIKVKVDPTQPKTILVVHEESGT